MSKINKLQILKNIEVRSGVMVDECGYIATFKSSYTELATIADKMLFEAIKEDFITPKTL